MGPYLENLSELVHTLGAMTGPGLLKGAWESKKLKKRRVLQCFLGRAGLHDRTHGTNILKILVIAILLKLPVILQL